MKKILLPIIGVIIFITAIGFLQNNFEGSFYNPLQDISPSPTPQPDLKEILLGDNKLLVEIAKTNEERRQGLSDRGSLEKGQGMLFIFNDNKRPTFWMKDMNFAIDIIWVYQDKIVGIEENIQPEPNNKDEDLSLYPAPQMIDYVIEVNAGYSEENSLVTGNTVDLSSINQER
jgi:uncharacterized membrane protein (UPF0127 family)